MAKTIFVGQLLAVLFVSQIANGQTTIDSSNSTGRAIAPTVAVSVGPFNATNTYLISPVQDSNGLKCELSAEMNKAKSELCFSNQQAINALREEYDKKYRDSVERMNVEAECWFGKMKGVLDEARDTNGEMITWIGIIVAVVIGVFTIVVSIFAIIIPVRKEKKREQEFRVVQENLKKEMKSYGELNGALQQWMSDYDQLKKDFDSQKAASDSLLNDLQGQKNAQESQFKELKENFTRIEGQMRHDSLESNVLEFHRDKTQAWRAAIAIKYASLALSSFISIKDVRWVQLTVWSLWNAITTNDWRDNRQKIKDELKEWTWSVSLTEVLENLKPKEDDDVKDYAGWFMEIYADYGKPKAA